MRTVIIPLFIKWFCSLSISSVFYSNYLTFSYIVQNVCNNLRIVLCVLFTIAFGVILKLGTGNKGKLSSLVSSHHCHQVRGENNPWAYYPVPVCEKQAFGGINAYSLSSRKLKAETWNRSHGRTLLTGLLPLSQLPFKNKYEPSYLGMTLPSINNLKMSYEYFTANLM